MKLLENPRLGSRATDILIG